MTTAANRSGSARGVDLPGYHRDGYAIVRSVLPDSALEPLIGRVAAEIDVLAGAGAEAGSIERRARALLSSPTPPRYFDRLLFSEQTCAILCHPALGDVLAAVLGPRVTYQGNGHLRMHPPGPLDPVPWHQDAQFYGAGTDDMASHMTQVWIPLVDAPVERGCLAVVPGSHRWGLQPEAVSGARNVVSSSAHRQEAIYRANGDRVRGEGVRALPMHRGDVVIFNSLLMHTGLENTSDVVRWSLDLRFEATYPPDDLDDRGRRGYAVMHQRLRGRGYVPLAIRASSGPGEGWTEWKARKAEVEEGRWRP